MPQVSARLWVRRNLLEPLRDTIGLVIASVDPMLKDSMKLGKFRSIGIIGGRTGAGPQIMAVDDAVKRPIQKLFL